MPASYYDKVLYPLQDHVISLFRGSPFYLTGGTALSRGYYKHRYSDDLDYFVNGHPDFERTAALQIQKLRDAFPDLAIPLRGKDFFRLFVAGDNLKIELINDVPSHVGVIVEHPSLGRIDSRENILANKLTALVDRALPKDVVDIYFLLRDGLSFRQAILNAGSKAAGTSPLLIAKVLTEFPYSTLEKEVKWVAPVRYVEIKAYLKGLSVAIVSGTVP